MPKTLQDIAQELVNSNNKVELIFAFNGVGKTRLSREFKKLVAPKVENENGELVYSNELSSKVVVYYSAFTEDLFNWNNDLDTDINFKLEIRPNSFTDWILTDEGKDVAIINQFKNYTQAKADPKFSEGNKDITFSLLNLDGSRTPKIKISKGEENNLIWSVFYNLLEEITAKTDDGSNPFPQLKYIFIDDPVSSLDDNNILKLGLSLARVINSSRSDLKFIITTHNTNLYKTLHSEIEKKVTKQGYVLENDQHTGYQLIPKPGHSNTYFSSHLKNLRQLTVATTSNPSIVERNHLPLLRSLYEKVAFFLGYANWRELLPKDDDNNGESYAKFINEGNHDYNNYDDVTPLKPHEKQTVALLLKNLENHVKFNSTESN